METELKTLELEAEVDGLGKVYVVCASFDVALNSLRDFKIENPITSRNLVYSRIKKRNISSLCRNGGYTREGFLHLRNEPYLLTLDSPLLDLELAEGAVKANGNNQYFSTDIRVYNKYREIAENDKSKEPEERSVLIIPKRENYEIPTNRFKEYEETRFLFKDQAEDYGNFLRENGINEMPVQLIDKRHVDSREGIVLNQLWVHDFVGRSGLKGFFRGLDGDCRVRGVIENQ